MLAATPSPDAVAEGGAGAGVAPASQDVGEAIELLLRGRQSREVSDLLATQYNERTDTLRLCLEEVSRRAARKRGRAHSRARAPWSLSGSGRWERGCIAQLPAGTWRGGCCGAAPGPRPPA